MVLFNYSTKELTAKVVYYGPGLCGKTTNLQWIHEKLPIKNKGKMLSLATETDRTLFFDFLPIELGTIRGMKTRIQLYTVPGQVFYNATRRMVLKGADCIVFVCDSQEPMLDANVESVENLKENLEVNEIDAGEIPMVLQYNKRDLPNALPIEILNERLNVRNLPFYEAIALKGIGVEETLKGVTSLVFRSLASKYGGESPGAQSASTPAPSANAAALRAQAPPTPAPVTQAAVAEAAAPKPVPAPLPALNLEPAMDSSEDLLDSLELQATPEESAEELNLVEEDPLPIEEEVHVDVGEIESLDFDTPLESPAAASAGKATLVTAPDEAADLRRKIGRPLMPALAEELNLDEINDEEMPLEESVAPPPAPPSAPEFEEFSVEVGEAEPAPAAAPPEVMRVAVGSSGEGDVTIPLEITLDSGARVQVQLHLRLSLKLSQ
jgi:signal recognition particle receptor subunit beta